MPQNRRQLFGNMIRVYMFSSTDRNNSPYRSLVRIDHYGWPNAVRVLKEVFPMTMTIAVHEVKTIPVLDLKGRITLGEGSVQIRDTIRDLVGKGQRSILLNLGDVNYIDSSGLGELVAAYTTARNVGAELKLLNLSKKVHDLLQLTKLYTVFEVYDDETIAIASFK